MTNTRRGRQNINMLLVVLIGFCVLAIIEIVYGQAQMKVERERLALEEQNSQTVEELKEEWRKLQDGSSVVTAQKEPETAESGKEPEDTSVKAVEQQKDKDANQGDAKPEESEDEEDEDKEDSRYSMQIAVLGDSIMD